MAILCVWYSLHCYCLIFIQWCLSTTWFWCWCWWRTTDDHYSVIHSLMMMTLWWWLSVLWCWWQWWWWWHYCLIFIILLWYGNSFSDVDGSIPLDHYQSLLMTSVQWHSTLWWYIPIRYSLRHTIHSDSILTMTTDVQCILHLLMMMSILMIPVIILFLFWPRAFILHSHIPTWLLHFPIPVLIVGSDVIVTEYLFRLMFGDNFVCWRHLY
jgi:hypothetical protein